MASLYFNNAVDFNWATLGNWWQDAACTIPAAALPGATDDAHLVAASNAALNTGGPITVATLNADSALVEIDITVTGGAVFSNSSTLTNNKTLTGNASFSGSSSLAAGSTVTGNADFADSSLNNGTVSGNATFANGSENNGTVSGGATFNASTCYGTVTGIALLHDSTLHGGTVGDGSELTGQSYLNSTVTIGGGTGTASLRGYSSSDGGTVNGNLRLYDNSGLFNYATVNGNVESFDSSYVSYSTVGGSLTRAASHTAGSFVGSSAGGGWVFGGSVYDFVPHSHYEIAEFSTVTYTSPTPVVFNLGAAQYYWSATQTLTFSGGMPTVNISGGQLSAYGASGPGSGIIYANISAASAGLAAPCAGNLYAENSNVYDEPMMSGAAIGGTATFVNTMNGYAWYGGSPGCSVTGQASYISSSVKGTNAWWGNAWVQHSGPVSFESAAYGYAPVHLGSFNGAVTMDVPAATSQIILGEGTYFTYFAAGLEIIGANRGINGSSILGVI